MTDPVIPYNAAMIIVAVALAVFVSRRRQFWPSVLGIGAAAFVAGTLAAILGSDIFDSARLLAWGAFVHGPLLLVVTAVSLRARAGALFVALAVAIAGVGFYAFRIEPSRLEVSRYRIASREVQAPLRIAVMADFQTDVIGEYQRRAIRTLVAQDADLILMPGDYIQVEDFITRQRLGAEMRALMMRERLRAPLGVIAVTGNVDAPQWPSFFAGLPVETATVTKTRTVGPIYVTPLGVDDSFDADLSVPDPGGFHIAFGHSPDFALGDIGADLLIAGHTHGGQVRLPVIGPLVTLSRVPRGWAAGKTDLAGGRTLIVSRGVGMERGHAPRLRFLCRPEIVVIDVVPS